MLSSIKLRFFQCYRGVEFLLSPLVNVVIGSSDSGKSALLRALELVIFNRPAGTTFRSWFAETDEDTSVLVATGEGRAVERVRGLKANYYQCDGGDQLKALQLRVPDEVAALLNIGSLNVQRQHDRYYMLQDTPGEVARKFNEIARLEEIDEAVTRLNKLENQTKTQIQETSKQLTEIDAQLETFGHLETVETLITQVAREVEELEQAERDVEALGDWIEAVKDVRQQITNVDYWLEIETPYQKLRAELDELEQDERDVYKLWSSVTTVRAFREQVARHEEILQAEPVAEKLITEIIDLRAAEQAMEALEAAIAAARGAATARVGEDARLKAFRAQFADLARQAGRCPFCFTEIDEDTINHILEHL
jgi:recombinational DNA repair ATPase RecF